MELSHKIIITLLVILILLTVYKKQENAGSTGSGTANYNTEAVQNIASVYAESGSGTATFNNINVTGNLRINNKKIRIFDMGGYKVGNSGDTNINWVQIGSDGTLIKDQSNNTYDGDKWICMVVGLYLPKDQNTTTSGAFYARASIKDNKWMVQFFEGGSDIDYIRARSIITILAIPIEMFDTNSNSIQFKNY
jgi:hypothetical protein